MGDIHIQMGLLSQFPQWRHTSSPSELWAFLSSPCYIFTYTGFLGHKQVIGSLRAAYGMMEQISPELENSHIVVQEFLGFNLLEDTLSAN